MCSTVILTRAVQAQKLSGWIDDYTEGKRIAFSSQCCIALSAPHPADLVANRHARKQATLGSWSHAIGKIADIQAIQ